MTEFSGNIGDHVVVMGKKGTIVSKCEIYGYPKLIVELDDSLFTSDRVIFTQTIVCSPLIALRDTKEDKK